MVHLYWVCFWDPSPAFGTASSLSVPQHITLLHWMPLLSNTISLYLSNPVT